MAERRMGFLERRPRILARDPLLLIKLLIYSRQTTRQTTDEDQLACRAALRNEKTRSEKNVIFFSNILHRISKKLGLKEYFFI